MASGGVSMHAMVPIVIVAIVGLLVALPSSIRHDLKIKRNNTTPTE